MEKANTARPGGPGVLSLTSYERPQGLGFLTFDARIARDTARNGLSVQRS